MRRVRYEHQIVVCIYPADRFSDPEYGSHEGACLSPARALRKWGNEGWRVAAMDLAPRPAGILDYIQTTIVFEREI